MEFQNPKKKIVITAAALTVATALTGGTIWALNRTNPEVETCQRIAQTYTENAKALEVKYPGFKHTVINAEECETHTTATLKKLNTENERLSNQITKLNEDKKQTQTKTSEKPKTETDKGKDTKPQETTTTTETTNKPTEKPVVQPATPTTKPAQPAPAPAPKPAQPAPKPTPAPAPKPAPAPAPKPAVPTQPAPAPAPKPAPTPGKDGWVETVENECWQCDGDTSGADFNCYIVPCTE